MSPVAGSSIPWADGKVDAWTREEAIVRAVEIIEALGVRWAIDLNPSAIRKVAERIFATAERVDNRQLSYALQAAGSQVGLAFTAGSIRGAEIFRAAAPPLILLTPTAKGCELVVILNRTKSKIEVMGRGWVTRRELSTLFNDAERFSVQMVTPQAPLASLSQTSEHFSMASRVASFLRLERDDLAVVFIFAVAVGLLSLATPIAVQSVVSSVASTGLVQPLAVLSALLLGALGLAALLRALQARVVEWLERRLLVRIALDFAFRFPRLTAAVRQARFGPHVANRFFEFVGLQKTASALLIDGIAVGLQAATGLLLMAFYHPYLLAFGIALTLLVGLIMVVPWKRGLRTAYEESSSKYAIAEWLEELSRVPQAFQGHAAARWAQEQTEVRVQTWLKARDSHFRVSFGQLSGALALHAVASTVLLAVGGALVMRSELTLGQLVAAELVVTSVTDALVKLGRLLDKAYDFTVSLEKVGGVVDLQLEESFTGEKLPPGTAGKKVEARGVKVAQSPAVTFTATPGAKMALLESHGTTRHRLAQVLSGHDLPDQGCLELDGVDTRSADLMEIRSRVALVRPEGIFEGTLYDNVAVGRAAVGPEQVRSALARVGLFDTLRELPAGLETVLSASGHPLSFDQQVQVLVARALAGKPRLIVVDDFLDALPSTSRGACIDALVQGQEHTLIAVCSDSGTALARRCHQAGVSP